MSARERLEVSPARRSRTTSPGRRAARPRHPRWPPAPGFRRRVLRRRASLSCRGVALRASSRATDPTHRRLVWGHGPVGSPSCSRSTRLRIALSPAHAMPPKRQGGRPATLQRETRRLEPRPARVSCRPHDRDLADGPQTQSLLRIGEPVVRRPLPGTATCALYRSSSKAAPMNRRAVRVPVSDRYPKSMPPFKPFSLSFRKKVSS